MASSDEKIEDLVSSCTPVQLKKRATADWKKGSPQLRAEGGSLGQNVFRKYSDRPV